MVLSNLLSPLKIAFKVTYILHFLLPYVPFFHLPSVCPAPGYVVEKVDSMLEAGDVIKQLGKDLLCVLPKDSKMFQVMNQIMNQIYWVNASLKSISPVNGMVHNVPLLLKQVNLHLQLLYHHLQFPSLLPNLAPAKLLLKNESNCCIWQ